MFKNIFKNKKWSFLVVWFLPQLKDGIEFLLELVKDKTPTYIDKIIDVTNKRFIGKLIEIKTDDISDDAGQFKDLLNREAKPYLLEVVDAGTEGLQDLLRKNELVKNEDVAFVIDRQLSELRFSLQELKLLEDKQTSEEVRAIALQRFADAKKKLPPELA